MLLLLASISYFLYAIFFHTKIIYGNLSVSTYSFQKEYDLILNKQAIAQISQLDSWYISFPYLYGTISKNNIFGYIIYDCTNDSFFITHHEDLFKEKLIQKKLQWKNFMSGENITEILFNQREYSSQCITNRTK